MAVFPTIRLPPGLNRLTWRQLFLLCVLLSGLMYFLRLRRPVTIRPVSGSRTLERGHDLSHRPTRTSWGAPLVWGDSEVSERQRAAFAQRSFRVGLMVLAVGRYTHYLQHFLQSAETHFLPGLPVNYYILTDNPEKLVPPPELGEERSLRVVPVAEMPGWEHLVRRRMDLLASTIDNQVQQEVDYVFCADVDQEFASQVGTEILGTLVATLDPQHTSMPIYTYPYERSPDSRACVLDEEGDYYYTSELYGGLCSEVMALTKVCSQLILQDHALGVEAQGLEESYLNRYLIDRRPTCVLSPEYSWWDSPVTPEVPQKRVISLGRQCASLRDQGKSALNC
ncbi:globoside alpha-1,3-N-acetylgalactosaminyltransferase 1 [Clupea harengus]|uniref:Globoside alpha-1,3-N-acetylgalactosaminyltransferase 1 n=1 Tax=Clupea harengus TaxID=7950 RepID=A0A6P3VZK6_CLUHA|nr:globoside alpha-1,3-N-acetylgalactosaminyltransferase 1 [Clupea harengus]